MMSRRVIQRALPATWPSSTATVCSPACGSASTGRSGKRRSNMPVEPAGTAVMDAPRVLVTLTIAGQLCGIPVDSVRDILGEQSITRIPLAPPEIAGSLNLRGRIVTAIDLRRRLQLPPAPQGQPRMSVVAEQGGELYALLVDQVSEVMSLDASLFERNPPTLEKN